MEMQTTPTRSAAKSATRCATGFVVVGSVLAVAVFALLGSVQVLAQDVERGQARSAECVACHGPAGISSNPMFPHLAGQNATYLELQLKKFQTGERYHPLMTPVAESLSPQDVQDLAVYFSSIGPLAIRR
ncbi:MAG: cytochrome c [Woeseia sp.]